MNLSQDWDYLLDIAKQRRRNNRTPWHVKKDYLEVLGAAGELAARRFLGLPEELHTHFDGGRDLIWRGYRVDVKATVLTPNVEFRFLQWPVRKIIKADIIFMMAVDKSTKTATPLGWCFNHELVGAQVNTGREYPCHEISVLELRPDWQLFSLRYLNRQEQKALRQFNSPSGATGPA